MPHLNTIALWQADTNTLPGMFLVQSFSLSLMPMQRRRISFQHTMKTTWPDYLMQEGSEMPLCPGNCRIETPLLGKLCCSLLLGCGCYVSLSLTLLSNFVMGRWELDLRQMFSNGQLILLERKETHAAITLGTLERPWGTQIPTDLVLNQDVCVQ